MNKLDSSYDDIDLYSRQRRSQSMSSDVDFAHPKYVSTPQVGQSEDENEVDQSVAEEVSYGDVILSQGTENDVTLSEETQSATDIELQNVGVVEPVNSRRGDPNGGDERRRRSSQMSEGSESVAELILQNRNVSNSSMESSVQQLSSSTEEPDNVDILAAQSESSTVDITLEKSRAGEESKSEYILVESEKRKMG